MGGAQRQLRVALVLAALAALSCAFAPRADAFLYWANSDGNTIGRANLDGSGVNNNFITGADRPCGVAVNAQHIYWANQFGSSIGRADLDGTHVNQSFITGAQLPCAPAVNETQIWWSNGETDGNIHNGTIARANLDGTGVSQSMFSNPQAYIPFGVALSSNMVYWVNQGPSSPNIYSAGLDGTPPPAPFVSNASLFSAAWPALTSTHLYWAGFNLGIARVDLSSPGSIDQVTGASATGGIATHGSILYWANLQEGTISRANLDGSSPDFAFARKLNGPSGLAVDSGLPSNKFSFGKLKRNKRKGTATLTVNVPDPGRLVLGGKGVVKKRSARARWATASKAVSAGKVKLRIKAKGKRKRKLNRAGKVKLKLAVTFTPTGGTPNAEVKKVKLIKR